MSCQLTDSRAARGFLIEIDGLTTCQRHYHPGEEASSLASVSFCRLYLFEVVLLCSKHYYVNTPIYISGCKNTNSQMKMCTCEMFLILHKHVR